MNSNVPDKSKLAAVFIIIASLIIFCPSWLHYNLLKGNEDLDIQVIAEIHKMRLKHIHEICRKYNIPVSEYKIQNQVYNVQLSEEKHVIFCPVAKVGTTFFTRLFNIIRTNQSIDDMYDMSIFVGARFSQYKTFHEIEENERQTTPKMIFVRNPKSRVVSAYLDKIYGVGGFKQRIPAILKSVRPNYTNESWICANDLTFNEFLEHVIKETKNGKGNRHWIPAYSRCGACSVDYDIIGKMETFSDDLRYAMHLIGYKDFPVVTNRETARLDSIKREIEKLFRIYTNSKFPSSECPFTIGQGYYRIWSILKIHGLVNKNIPIPPSETFLGNLNNISMVNLSKMFRGNSKLQEQVKKAEQDLQDYVIRIYKTQDPKGEKYNAIEYLFRNISKDTEARLKDAYKYDYLLFGYD